MLFFGTELLYNKKMALFKKSDLHIPPKNVHFDELRLKNSKNKPNGTQLGVVPKRVYDQERAVLQGKIDDDEPADFIKKVDQAVKKNIKRNNRREDRLLKAERELLDILSDEYSDRGSVGGSDEDDDDDDEDNRAIRKRKAKRAVDDDDQIREDIDDIEDADNDGGADDDDDDDDDVDDDDDERKADKGNALLARKTTKKDVDKNFDNKTDDKSTDTSSSEDESSPGESSSDEDCSSSCSDDFQPVIISRKSTAKPAKSILDKWSGTIWSEKEKKKRYLKRKREVQDMFETTTGNDALMRYAKRHGIMDDEEKSKKEKKEKKTKNMFKTKNGRRSTRGSLATKYITSVMGPGFAKQLCVGKRGQGLERASSGGGVTSAVPLVNREFMEYVTRPSMVVDLNTTDPLTPRQLARRPTGTYMQQLPISGRSLTTQPTDVYNAKNAGVYTGHDIDYKAMTGQIDAFTHLMPMYDAGVSGTRPGVPENLIPIFEANERYNAASTPLMDMILEREIEGQSSVVPRSGPTVIPGSYDVNPGVGDSISRTRDTFYRYGNLRSMRGMVSDY